VKKYDFLKKSFKKIEDRKYNKNMKTIDLKK